jgi:hypothetical protein
LHRVEVEEHYEASYRDEQLQHDLDLTLAKLHAANANAASGSHETDLWIAHAESIDAARKSEVRLSALAAVEARVRPTQQLVRERAEIRARRSALLVTLRRE